MAMLAKMTFAAAMLLASATGAQTPARHTASPQEIAAATERADRILAAGGAADVFENVTRDGTPRLRHRGSGLVCSFTGAGRDDYVRILPETPGGPPRGDDVACGTRLADTVTIIYATRYPGHPGEEDVYASTMAAVAATARDARPYRGALPVATMEGRPRPRGGALTMTLSGRRVLSLVFVAQAGDWSFKGQTTAPANNEMVILLAPMMFTQALPDAREAAGQ